MPLTVDLLIEGQSDRSELDLMTQQLVEEVEHISSVEVEMKSVPAPINAKSAETVTLGALAIAVLPSFLPKLLDVIRDWATRGSGKSIKIAVQAGDKKVEIEFTPEKPMSKKEVDAWSRELLQNLERD